MNLLADLAATLSLGDLLALLRERVGAYELVAHWEQGEFHHDVVVELGAKCIDFRFLVVATNCNGGVKEVLALATPPERDCLWHWRCPHVRDFGGRPLDVLERATTPHWFDPCELLGADARSELRAEFRERQHGGGWKKLGRGGGP